MTDFGNYDRSTPLYTDERAVEQLKNAIEHYALLEIECERSFSQYQIESTPEAQRRYEVACEVLSEQRRNINRVSLPVMIHLLEEFEARREDAAIRLVKNPMSASAQAEYSWAANTEEQQSERISGRPLHQHMQYLRFLEDERSTAKEQYERTKSDKELARYQRLDSAVASENQRVIKYGLEANLHYLDLLTGNRDQEAIHCAQEFTSESDTYYRHTEECARAQRNRIAAFPLEDYLAYLLKQLAHVRASLGSGNSKEVLLAETLYFTRRWTLLAEIVKNRVDEEGSLAAERALMRVRRLYGELLKDEQMPASLKDKFPQQPMGLLSDDAPSLLPGSLEPTEIITNNLARKKFPSIIYPEEPIFLQEYVRGEQQNVSEDDNYPPYQQRLNRLSSEIENMRAKKS